MDFKQKYIEVLNYDIDDWFLSRLGALELSRSRDILKQITNAEEDLPIQNGWSQIIAGVTKEKNPYFFEIEYLKQEDDYTVFLDIKEIDSDSYLDYYNLNQTLNLCTKNTETTKRSISLSR